ncbi:hypothetical protein VWZ37_22480, partial [Xanthomonas citri pv. citri]
ARMVGTLLWLNHLEACPMRAPSSTAWPTKRLISQEEMWGNLRNRVIRVRHAERFRRGHTMVSGG